MESDPNQDIPQRNLASRQVPLENFPKGVRVQRPNLPNLLKEKSREEGKAGGPMRKQGSGVGQPIGVSECPEKKAVVVFVLTFLVCSLGTAVGRSVGLYDCNPPFEMKKKTRPALAHAHEIRRNVHTDIRPQQSREAEVRGFPVFEGRLLVLTLQLDHITPNLRQTDRQGRKTLTDCL